MRDLRDISGVTAIVYVQTCAAELRRLRKRNLADDPNIRLFINPAVCEGCGDCSAQSNCIAIEPLETEMGRKRQINQSTCNKDLSCLKGFCPAFVTVRGGQLKRQRSTETPIFRPYRNQYFLTWPNRGTLLSQGLVVLAFLPSEPWVWPHTLKVKTP